MPGYGCSGLVADGFPHVQCLREQSAGFLGLAQAKGTTSDLVQCPGFGCPIP
jgi:hypothetical protein